MNYYDIPKCMKPLSKSWKIVGNFSRSNFVVARYPTNDYYNAIKCGRKVEELHKTTGKRSIERWNGLVDIANEHKIYIGERAEPEELDLSQYVEIPDYQNYVVDDD